MCGARQRNGTALAQRIDLSHVPPQPPILKNAGRIKDGASKYTGVSFHKQQNKWQASIMIDGRQQSIGYYDNEEEAAVDYARALFKYEERRQRGILHPHTSALIKSAWGDKRTLDNKE